MTWLGMRYLLSELPLTSSAWKRLARDVGRALLCAQESDVDINLDQLSTGKKVWAGAHKRYEDSK